MRICKVTNLCLGNEGTLVKNPTFKSYKINVKENKEVKYLYNKVLDTFDKQQIPTVYTNDYIRFDRITNHIKYKFKKYGIKFHKVKESK